MNIIQAVLLGIVEGLTEFLPISSTAHLIIVSRFMQLPQTDFQKLFEVFIQGGAILAVIFLYGGYIVKHKKLLKPIFLSFVPTAIIGFLLYKIIKTVFFDSSYLIIVAMAGVGSVFLIVEQLVQRKKINLSHTLSNVGPTQAVLIGLAQALATIPGVSRSGIIMVYMMVCGYKREDAALYSFLLAVPTILAASVYDLFKMRHLLFQSASYLPLLITGFIVSFAVAYLVMKWFISYLRRNSLVSFGIYRIILAIILLFFG
jgi:undecaprenyl-diphosphatase